MSIKIMLSRFFAVFLLACCAAAVATDEDQKCKSDYQGRRPTPQQLETIIRKHQEWLESGAKQGDKRRANLCQSDLNRVNLSGINLTGSDLRGANLSGANLKGSVLRGAKLNGANLAEANLEDAMVWWANLQGVYLGGANLQNAFFRDSTLTNVIYEPQPEKLPILNALIPPSTNMDRMLFKEDPSALIALREAFKKAGMRMAERQITYAIEHSRRLLAWNPQRYDPQIEDPRSWLEKIASKSESLFNYIFFEVPSGYGMMPGRALSILVTMIPCFSVFYWFAVRSKTSGPAAIWVTWPADRVDQQEGMTQATRISSNFLFPKLQRHAAGRWWSIFIGAPLIGLYFSLLSAFSIGWRELNFGNWITRMQPREYFLRATGWVRTVSGVQSLLSVYLLALWILTYFGRPFE